VHSALGGGHYEAGLGPWSSSVRRSLKSIGSAASGRASELEVDEGPGASSSAGSRERASRTAHGGGGKEAFVVLPP
jgi:hypothetical protein